MAEKLRVRVRAGSGKITKDSFQNVAARLGLGTDNVASGATYAFNPVTRNRTQLEWMYRGSWLIGQVVDCVAEDMVRAGISINASVDPDKISQLQNAIDDLGIWHSVEQLIKWGRLYGGALAVHLVKDQNLEDPLDPSSIGPDQYKGLLVLDRWSVMPSISDLVQEYGPNMGQPQYYVVAASAPALRNSRIHHSRVIRFDGIMLPYWQQLAESGWGMSVVERLYDRLVAFDSTTQGAAQLVYKAHLRTIKVENLREILAEGGPAETALVKMMDMIRKLQTSEGLTIIDAQDSFETNTYTFSGLSDMLIQFAQQISGAAQIPLVRLFGQSPSGLNATGDGEIRTYYDMIAQSQESRLRSGFAQIIDMTYRSKFHVDPPEDLTFIFNALWQLSSAEKAQITLGITNAVTAAYDSGIVDRAIALKELKQSSDVTGTWSNIDDNDITEAEEEQPPEPVEVNIPDDESSTAAAAELDEPDDGSPEEPDA